MSEQRINDWQAQILILNGRVADDGQEIARLRAALAQAEKERDETAIVYEYLMLKMVEFLRCRDAYPTIWPAPAGPPSGHQS